jgi:hypothetical protein
MELRAEALQGGVRHAGRSETHYGPPVLSSLFRKDNGQTTGTGDQAQRSFD